MNKVTTCKNVYQFKSVEYNGNTIYKIIDKQGTYINSCSNDGLKDMVSHLKDKDKFIKNEEELQKLILKSKNWRQEYEEALKV